MVICLDGSTVIDHVINEHVHLFIYSTCSAADWALLCFILWFCSVNDKITRWLLCITLGNYLICIKWINGVVDDQQETDEINNLTFSICTLLSKIRLTRPPTRGNALRTRQEGTIPLAHHFRSRHIRVTHEWELSFLKLTCLNSLKYPTKSTSKHYPCSMFYHNWLSCYD